MKPLSAEYRRLLVSEYFPDDGRDVGFTDEATRCEYLLSRVESIAEQHRCSPDEVVAALLSQSRKSARRSVGA